MQAVRIMTFGPSSTTAKPIMEEKDLVVINLDQVAAWEKDSDYPYFVLVQMANGQCYYVLEKELENKVKFL